MLGKMEYPSDSTQSEKAKKVKKESNKTKNNENKVDISSGDKNETTVNQQTPRYYRGAFLFELCKEFEEICQTVLIVVSEGYIRCNRF